MRRALAVLFLAACCPKPPVVPPPVSFACKLKEPVPEWFEVEVTDQAGCPQSQICLTLRGGQAIVLNKRSFVSWSQEMKARCGGQR